MAESQSNYVEPSPKPNAALADKGDGGYDKALHNRHMQMIAIGGSIGTGLFLGAGGRLAQGGPGLAIAYAVCGFFAFIMVRALGELAIYRPSSGAFVSYAREFMGEKGAYATGWLFFLDWAVTAMADITAVALYMHYWPTFRGIPQWVLALVALAIVFALNIMSVKFFGEMEFWFALIKVVTILSFMALAIWAIVTERVMSVPVNVGNMDSVQLADRTSRIELYSHVANGHFEVTSGFHNWTSFGGFLPMGSFAIVTLSMGVIFAFGGTEMIGVAAGEAKNAREILPKAVNSMIGRIAFFYVGAVVLMTLVLPWTAYDKNQSPFVTFFTALGVPHAGDIVQIVVLTAALSSLNAGLYATGRTLRSMALAGEAPAVAAKLNRHQVPAGGIAITAGLGIVGVIINAVVPASAFNIIMDVAAVGIAGTWISVLISHWIFVNHAKQGLVERPSYRLRFAPWSNLIGIIFFAIVILAMGMSDDGLITLGIALGCVLAMVIGWYAVRDRIDADLMDNMLVEDIEDPLGASAEAAVEVALQQAEEGRA